MRHRPKFIGRLIRSLFSGRGPWRALRPWRAIAGPGAAGAVAAAMLAQPCFAAVPARVVSLNVCTDQLAMLIAAPGQLVAVSHLAREPQSSAMAADAAAFAVTSGAAEDVFRLKPDLVLAGAYTTPVTVRLLEQLGVRVERFASATSIDAIASDLRRMGRVLGQEATAEALAVAMSARLERLAAAIAGSPPVRAIFLDANSYTAGAGTLMDSLIAAAGFRNIAADLRLTDTARLPLERLVLGKPQVLLVPERYGQPSQGEAVLDHPAVHGLIGHPPAIEVNGAAAVCATPATVATAEHLAAIGRAYAKGQGMADE